MIDTSAPAWLETPLGAAVLELETHVLADALADVFGFELVQLGCWGRAGEASTSARTQHRCWLAPDASGPGAIRAEFMRSRSRPDPSRRSCSRTRSSMRLIRTRCCAKWSECWWARVTC